MSGISTIHLPQSILIKFARFLNREFPITLPLKIVFLLSIALPPLCAANRDNLPSVWMDCYLHISNTATRGSNGSQTCTAVPGILSALRLILGLTRVRRHRREEMTH